MTMFVRILAGAVMATAATQASAHTGLAPHEHGFATGFLHPFGGADHVLAMVAVGLWAGFVGGRAAWAWPAAFVTAMTGAAAAGAAGLSLPAQEMGIALSVILLGGVLALGLRAPLAAGAAACCAFAVFHGIAHGTEMPADVAGLAYGAGFVAATAILHAIGLAGAAAIRLGSTPVAARVTGAMLAAAGVGLAAG